jgi:hypothetical protein
MKRLYLILIFILALSLPSYAGQKITDLDAIGSLSLTDVLEVVDDPGGSPLSRKATMQQVADVVKTDSTLAGVIAKTGYASVTTAAISATIGATGDYATHALAMAAVPDLLAHGVTHIIQAGTTLTEKCIIRNKHATSSDGSYTLRAEKYYPTSGVPLTADSATGTTLVDAALATAALGDDYFNGCWIFIIDGTGTDNGFVAITDYTDSTGTVTVASWPGTQPDATSRYIIVGAIIDNGVLNEDINVSCCSSPISLVGIGVKDTVAYSAGIQIENCFYVAIDFCGAYNTGHFGIRGSFSIEITMSGCGVVGCNADNNALCGGIGSFATGYFQIYACGISDNGQRGAYGSLGGFTRMIDCFGDANGDFGTYADNGARTWGAGTECSGSSGDHANAVGDGSLSY